MIEELRIQCPSCGIVLDVRNSKQEAVKRIACPNCHKQLAVDFREEEPAPAPKPLEPLYYGAMRIDLHEGVNQIPLPGNEFVEIKVVRLKDGNSKCIVRSLSAEHPVYVNDELLSPDDEVALSVGDRLRVGDTALNYGQPDENHGESHGDESSDSGFDQNRELDPEIPQKPKPKWPYMVIAIAALAVCLFSIKHFIPEKKIVKTTPVEVPDTSKPKEIVEPPIKERKIERKAVEDVVKQTDYTKLTTYELSQLSKKDDARAQYELGKRYVKGSGQNTVILGINYLKAASRNGLPDAKTALEKVINRLQRQADHGDSVAYQILMSIDNQ